MTETSHASRQDSGESSEPTTKSVYRAGIIGMGFIGVDAEDSHRRAYDDCDRTVVRALCDVDASKGHVYTDYSLREHFYSGYLEMVKAENLDIVSVCTPVGAHCKIVCDIAPYVRSIYCEKPMASTIGDCLDMIRVCEKHNTILQINHQRSFVKPLFRFSRDLIDTGTHVFAWLDYHEIDADVEYIDSQEHIFELVITRERMVLAGVEWLVGVLDGTNYQKSDGNTGLFALNQALKFKEQYESETLRS